MVAKRREGYEPAEMVSARLESRLRVKEILPENVHSEDVRCREGWLTRRTRTAEKDVSKSASRRGDVETGMCMRR